MPTAYTHAEIVEKVCQLAAEEAGVNRTTVTLDTHLFDDLNFDSLAAVEFVMRLEDAFEVSVPDEQADVVKTVGQAVEMLMDLRCRVAPQAKANSA